MKRGNIAWTVFLALGLGLGAGCSDTTNTFGSSAGGAGGGGGAGTVKIALMTNAVLGIYNGTQLATMPAGAEQGSPVAVADGGQPNSLDLPFPVGATSNSYGIFVDPNFTLAIAGTLHKSNFPTYGQMKTWTLHYDIATTIPLTNINSIAIIWGPSGYPGSSTTIWPVDYATDSTSWSSLNATTPLGTFVSCVAKPSNFIGGLPNPVPNDEPVNQLFLIEASMRGPLPANGDIYIDNIYWSTN